MSLLASYGVDLGICRYAGQLYEYRYHCLACKVDQRICKITVCVLPEVPKQSSIKLFFIKRRLQVNGQRIFRFAEIAHMRARRKHKRSAHAKVSEQHFAEFFVYELSVFKCGKRYISKRKALHPTAIFIVAFERNE